MLLCKFNIKFSSTHPADKSIGVNVLDVPGIIVGFPGTVYFKSKGMVGVLVC